MRRLPLPLVAVAVALAALAAVRAAAPPRQGAAADSFFSISAWRIHDKVRALGRLRFTADTIQFESPSNPGEAFTWPRAGLEKIEPHRDGTVAFQVRGQDTVTVAVADAGAASKSSPSHTTYNGAAFIVLALAQPDAFPGLQPPPGTAARLTVGQADAMLHAALGHVFAGDIGGLRYSAPVNVAAGAQGFSLHQSVQEIAGKRAGQQPPAIPDDFSAQFVSASVYLTLGRNYRGQSGAHLTDPPKPWRNAVDLVLPHDIDWLLFTDPTQAQAFADAYNRLLYAAYHPDQEASAWARFNASAQAWRSQNPKPPLTVEADRERILAENAVAEKQPETALEHYEAGLARQPLWPEGWYNAAVLYGAMDDPTMAADRMQHYLTLAPDAPDARAAYEQIVIWKDQATHKN